ncbi:MAG: hypothetical protein LBO74_04025, partial [Candidatus Symbiothrix sp.]|jgi:hypothetical protein|nr:hypothetical protein [Candidatus Symbiothrix sp.]
LPFGLQAQVTIGGVNDPQAGAILDLNSTVKGGLVLSNVEIIDLGKIPTGANGFAGITAGTDDDTNVALTGTIVYNSKGIEGIPQGVYVWDGENWQTISGASAAAGDCDAVCVRIQNVVLTAKTSTLIIGSSGSALFELLSDGSNCYNVDPSNKKTYEWYRTGADNDTYEPQGTTEYDTPSKTIVFPSAGTYKVKVVAKNCYSPTGVESNIVTVTVATTPPTNSAYTVTGVTCYDVAQSGTLTSRTNAFADTHTMTYTFNYGNSFTNLSFEVLDDPRGIISDVSAPSANSGSGSSTQNFDVTFSSSVESIVYGSFATAQIAASYTDYNGIQKYATLDVVVSDKNCCTTVLGTDGWCYSRGHASGTFKDKGLCNDGYEAVSWDKMAHAVTDKMWYKKYIDVTRVWRNAVNNNREYVYISGQLWVFNTLDSDSTAKYVVICRR